MSNEEIDTEDKEPPIRPERFEWEGNELVEVKTGVIGTANGLPIYKKPSPR